MWGGNFSRRPKFGSYGGEWKKEVLDWRSLGVWYSSRKAPPGTPVKCTSQENVSKKTIVTIGRTYVSQMDHKVLSHRLGAAHEASSWLHHGCCTGSGKVAAKAVSR